MRQMLIVLALVTLLAGVVLAAAYTAFQPRIIANQEAALNRSLGALFDAGDGVSFAELDMEGPQVYRGTDSAGNSLGYAVELTTTGYGGEIRMLVGLGPNLEELSGIEIVEQVETPGLGARIDEEWFKDQFDGLDPTEELGYVKNQEPDPETNNVQAISGATISTEAVTDGINTGLEGILSRLKSAASGGGQS
jgi:RnfABCDGE-type electron transport complex G subunit